MISVIFAEDAEEDENIVATENAVGALGKVIYFQKDNNVVTDETVKKFLSKLPLTSEEEEAQKSHKLFLQMVLSNNSFLVNDNTKSLVMQAVMSLQSENDDFPLVDEEGLVLLKSVLGN